MPAPMNKEPLSRFRNRILLGSASFSRICPAKTAYKLSSSVARQRNVAESSAICASAGLAGLTNCGKKAAKNKIVLGFVNETKNPRQYTAFVGGGAAKALLSSTDAQCHC